MTNNIATDSQAAALAPETVIRLVRTWDTIDNLSRDLRKIVRLYPNGSETAREILGGLLTGDCRTRLERSKAECAAVSMRHGLEAGTEWAQKFARYDILKFVAELNFAPSNFPGRVSKWLCEEVYRRFGGDDNFLPPSETDSYCEGFVAAARTVYLAFVFNPDGERAK